MAERNPGGSKGRILFLRSWLLDHTDAKHLISTEEILFLCRAHGYSANRNTLADDIDVLLSSGLDVRCRTIARKGTGTNGYYVRSRPFEQAELKLLVDAVASSRFITEEKSAVLTEKLALLATEENRPSLVSRTFIADRLKTDNPEVLSLIDDIFQAIHDRRKVTFHYWDYTPRKKKVLRHDGELYTASPFALVWNDDRYYMAAFSDKRKKIVNFRVDRMCDLDITDEPAVTDESFNPADHTRRVMRMFDGDQRPRRVTLLCQNQYMQNVLDRFGEKTKTKVADAEHFTAQVTVCPSSTFFSWVTQFRGGILIQEPDGVKQEYEELLQELLAEQEGILVFGAAAVSEEEAAPEDGGGEELLSSPEQAGSWRYCVAGRITKTPPEEAAYGAELFAPGARVYLHGKYWPVNSPDIFVIGKNRSGTFVYERIAVDLIENVRVQKVSSRAVVRMMDEQEQDEGLPWWGRSELDRWDAESFADSWRESAGEAEELSRG